MRWITTCSLVLLMVNAAHAQQSKDLDHYTVHYNAISTSQLPAQVAQGYGIQRSSNRALINVTVMDNTSGEPSPVTADLDVSARNLTGQVRSIDMREINEAQEAIYYIGEFRVNNMETFDFLVQITPEGESEPLELKFRQQFYTE